MTEKNQKKHNPPLTRIPDELKDEVEKQLEENLSPGGGRKQQSPSIQQTPTARLIDTGIGSEEARINSAQLIGRVSDQVLTGSPAQEAGMTGRYNLKNIVEKSYHPKKDGPDRKKD